MFAGITRLNYVLVSPCASNKVFNEVEREHMTKSLMVMFNLLHVSLSSSNFIKFVLESMLSSPVNFFPYFDLVIRFWSALKSAQQSAHAPKVPINILGT